MLYSTLLFLHLAGAIVWIGGMFFAYFCLRPAAGLLEPPQRLALWAATFSRFLLYAALAVVALLGSGFSMLALIGIGRPPLGWIAMMVLGLAMAGVFVYVYAGLYPQLLKHTRAAAWPAAAAALNSIRRLVAVNLVLSVAVVASVVSAR
ncbi:MAG TPA: CopD family protein [Burkholderiales bacterium]|nr:CopD family protein [Burkholderiales bacterium]